MNSSADPSLSAKPGLRVDAETHLYANGQSVRLKNGYMSVGNVYRIIASLPPNGDTPQYRIRNEAEKFERMALQSDLEAIATTPPVKGETSTESIFGARSWV
jgi:hypothetical protein